MDFPKAEEYFRRAAKYAEVENDPRAARMINFLVGDVGKPLNEQVIPQEAVRKITAESLRLAAIACFIQEKFQDAAELAGKAFDLYETELEAGYVKAKALHALGRMDQVPNLLERIITREPTYAIKTAFDFAGNAEVVAVLRRLKDWHIQRASEVLKLCQQAAVEGSVAGVALVAAEALVKKDTLLDAAEAWHALTEPTEVGGMPVENLQFYLFRERSEYETLRKRLENVKALLVPDSEALSIVNDLSEKFQNKNGQSNIGKIAKEFRRKRRWKTLEQEQSIEEFVIEERVLRAEKAFHAADLSAQEARKQMERLEQLIIARNAEKQIQDRKWFFPRDDTELARLEAEIRSIDGGEMSQALTRCESLQKKARELQNQIAAENLRAADLLASRGKELQDLHFKLLGDSKILVAFGHDDCGKAVISDLQELGDIFVIGQEVSQVCDFVTEVVASALSRFQPSQVRCLLVDTVPGRLSLLSTVPHLIVPVVHKQQQVRPLLNWLADEMDERIRLFGQRGVSNLADFNKWQPEQEKSVSEDQAEEDRDNDDLNNGPPANLPDSTLPQTLSTILVIIHDANDVAAYPGSEVIDLLKLVLEQGINAGIHFIFIAHGLNNDFVKSSVVPICAARIAFKVDLNNEAQFSLGIAGAEALASDEMLCRLPKPNRLIKCRPPVSVSELKHVFESIVDMPSQNGGNSTVANDLVPRAIEVIKREGRVSVTLLQQRLQLSFKEAIELIGTLEVLKVVGPKQGKEPRQILVDPEGKQKGDGRKEGVRLEIVARPREDIFQKASHHQMQVFGPNIPKTGYFFSSTNPFMDFVKQERPNPKLGDQADLDAYVDHFTSYGYTFVLSDGKRITVFSELKPDFGSEAIDEMEQTLWLRPEMPVTWVNNRASYTAEEFLYSPDQVFDNMDSEDSARLRRG